jgi:hypothetical protein
MHCPDGTLVPPNCWRASLWAIGHLLGADGAAQDAHAHLCCWDIDAQLALLSWRRLWLRAISVLIGS